MRFRFVLVTVVVVLLGTIMLGQGQRRQRLNPMIDLLEQKKVIIGVGQPSNPRGQAPAARGEGGAPRGQGGGGAEATAAAAPATTPVPDACGIVPAPRGEGRGGGGGGAARGGGRGDAAARGGGRGETARGGETPAAPPVMRTPTELAKMAIDFKAADYIYNGGMEGGNVQGQIAAFTEFMKGMQASGALSKTPYARLTHPMVLKSPKISRNPAQAIQNISMQLNAGVSTLMFVEVDCAKEVELGLQAMRFRSKGGTRPESVGFAPEYWGMTEQQYKTKADVWPLNPDGELVNWSIIETREGLARTREIAAVKGIGVLWPGAGSLRGVLANDPDPNAHENAVQKVLAACKEFNIACGYPIGASDAGITEMENRIKQGFTVFVIQAFNEAAFKTVEAGRKAGGRPPTNQ